MKENLAVNRRLALWRVIWLIENFTAHQFFGVLKVLYSELLPNPYRQTLIVQHRKRHFNK